MSRISGFRYRLYSSDWDELGEFVTAVPNRSQGDEFTAGRGRRFRITGSSVPMTTGIVIALWRVESVSVETPTGYR